MFIFLVYLTYPFNPKDHVPHGRCDEYLSLWPYSDYTGHKTLSCFSLIKLQTKAVAGYKFIR